METNIIKVGNSKGIIIPSKLLKMIGLTDKARIKVLDDKIMIEPIKNPREGWEELILADIEKNGVPVNELPDVFEDENFEEW
ncbi:MAG: AbrB/MazE/SpoVT family DNA-binding domain-containing protein [Flavobacteriaceae bacterium]|jgi:antitoxin MazE|nr:AbrB/MazE/SpoVT family DNA-binding domain-containing protein [Flavobacteriaceae bacterium]